MVLVSQECLLETTSATEKLNAIDDKVTKLLERRDSETLDSVKTTFKCLICLEIHCSMMFFCIYGCGRLIGCFTCCYRLNRCPNCRKKLPGKAIRKPIIIPGLAKSLKIEEVTRVEFERQLEAIKGTDVFTDDSQGSDLEELEELPLSSIRHVELTQGPVM